jgi:hypothetical protein
MVSFRIAKDVEVRAAAGGTPQRPLCEILDGRLSGGSTQATPRLQMSGLPEYRGSVSHSWSFALWERQREYALQRRAKRPRLAGEGWQKRRAENILAGHCIISVVPLAAVCGQVLAHKASATAVRKAVPAIRRHRLQPRNKAGERENFGPDVPFRIVQHQTSPLCFTASAPTA